MSILDLFPGPKKNEFEQTKELQDRASKDNIVINEAAPDSKSAEVAQIELEKQDRKDDLTRWQQNLEPELRQLVHDLKKEVCVGKGENGHEEWKCIDEEPVCTEEYVLRFLTKVRPFMSKNLMMSNYSEERILNTIKSSLLDLRCDIGLNREKYEIDKGDMDHIVQVFKSYTIPTLFRPMNQGESKSRKRPGFCK